MADNLGSFSINCSSLCFVSTDEIIQGKKVTLLFRNRWRRAAQNGHMRGGWNCLRRQNEAEQLANIRLYYVSKLSQPLFAGHQVSLYTQRQQRPGPNARWNPSPSTWLRSQPASQWLQSRRLGWIRHFRSPALGRRYAHHRLRHWWRHSHPRRRRRGWLPVGRGPRTERILDQVFR